MNTCANIISSVVSVALLSSVLTSCAIPQTGAQKQRETHAVQTPEASTENTETSAESSSESSTETSAETSAESSEESSLERTPNPEPEKTIAPSDTQDPIPSIPLEKDETVEPSSSAQSGETQGSETQTGAVKDDESASLATSADSSSAQSSSEQGSETQTDAAKDDESTSSDASADSSSDQSSEAQTDAVKDDESASSGVSADNSSEKSSEVKEDESASSDVSADNSSAQNNTTQNNATSQAETTVITLPHTESTVLIPRANGTFVLDPRKATEFISSADGQTISEPVSKEEKIPTDVLDRLVAKLNSIQYEDTVSDALQKRLTLEESFNKVKANLESYLAAVIWASASDPSAVEAAIDAKPAEFLLGLSYMERWYNFNYGGVPAGLAMALYPEWVSQKSVTGNKPEEVLINLTTTDNYDFLLTKAENLYKQKYAERFGLESIRDFIDVNYNRHEKTDYADHDAWLIAQSKAYIKREQTRLNSTNAPGLTAEEIKAAQDASSVWDSVSTEMLLSLLSLPDESIYMIVTMGSIAMGSYARYEGKSKEEMRSIVNNYAEKQASFFDFWYKILSKDSRSHLLADIPVMDSFYQNGVWTTEDLFFYPLELTYGHRPVYADADTKNHKIRFFNGYLLSDSATVTFTHEFIHFHDKDAFLAGYGQRPGSGDETYAEGLFQSLTGLEDTTLGVNNLYIGDSASRVQVSNHYDRLQSVDDINTYMKRSFDLLYLLDYIEAQAVAAQSANSTRGNQWWKALTSVDSGEYYNGTSMSDKFDNTNPTLDVYNNLVDQLVDQQLVGNIVTGHPTKQLIGTFAPNSYHQIDMFNADFTSQYHEGGMSGEYTFRRLAYEFWAEFGFEEGFIGYTGKARTDKQFLDEVLVPKGYNSFSEFKKAMIQRRIDKAENLTGTIDYNEMVARIAQAVRQDMNNMKRPDRVHAVKKEIYAQYLKETNDFRNPVFSNEEQ